MRSLQQLPAMRREREGCGARVSSGFSDRQYAHARLLRPRALACLPGSAGLSFRGLDMDEDLNGLPREQLIDEVKRLRAGIRAHRDSSGHELCWHHPDLWSLLPEPLESKIAVPDWPQFMRGCIRYRQSLDEQLPDAPRTTGEFDK